MNHPLTPASADVFTSIDRRSLDELKQRIRLLAYLQNYLQWEPRRPTAGGQVAGLLPLHSETQPSFTDPSTQASVLLPRMRPRWRSNPYGGTLSRHDLHPSLGTPALPDHRYQPMGGRHRLLPRTVLLTAPPEALKLILTPTRLARSRHLPRPAHRLCPWCLSARPSAIPRLLPRPDPPIRSHNPPRPRHPLPPYCLSLRRQPLWPQSRLLCHPPLPTPFQGWTVPLALSPSRSRSSTRRGTLRSRRPFPGGLLQRHLRQEARHRLNRSQFQQLITGSRTIWIVFDSDDAGQRSRRPTLAPVAASRPDGPPRPPTLSPRSRQLLRLRRRCYPVPSLDASGPAMKISVLLFLLVSLPPSASPYRLLDERGQEVTWANQFLDARRLGLRSLRSLCALIAFGLLHFAAYSLSPRAILLSGLPHTLEDLTESRNSGRLHRRSTQSATTSLAHRPLIPGSA